MSRLVKRTVTVLKALDSRPSSLHDLFAQTGIHRSTLLRILESLIEEKLVRRSLGDGTYHLTKALRALGQGTTPADHIAELASDLLRDHAEVVKWPTDILLPHPRLPCLVVIETNRPQSPFPVKPNQIGHKVPMLPSAAGRTYLAFLEPSKRKAMLERLFSRERPTFEHPPKIESLHAELDAIQQRGFGTRSRFFRGGSYSEEASEQDGLLALAVPILDGPRIVAVANTQWSSRAHSEAGFSDHFLSEQVELAQAISNRIAKNIHF